jgi:prepilin-type N-terminal cleavage/methylation domain-containing protein
MMRSLKNPCSRGFTLLEIMLAIAILALVLVMIAGSVNAIAHSKLQAESRLYTASEGRAILWQMSNELRGAVQTPLVLSNVLLLGRGQMHNGMAIDALTVSTLDPGHRRSIIGFGSEDIVSYTCSPNSAHPGWFVLTRSQSSGLMGGGGAGRSAPSVVLADSLVELHLRYFNGVQWVESWNSSAMPPNQQLPAAVAIELELVDNDGSTMNFSTQVTLPMAVSIW